jgi:hypothetical protein
MLKPEGDVPSIKSLLKLKKRYEAPAEDELPVNYRSIDNICWYICRLGMKGYYTCPVVTSVKKRYEAPAEDELPVNYRSIDIICWYTVYVDSV